MLAVLGDRYRLPVERLAPGQVAVAEAAQAGMPVRALARRGGRWCRSPHGLERVAPRPPGRLGVLGPAPDEVVGGVGGQHFSWVARTGVDIAAPSVEVTVLDATDPRLPDWVIGHFSGEARVVVDDDGQVLSVAVLKRYDDRLVEISVGTAEAARAAARPRRSPSPPPGRSRRGPGRALQPRRHQPELGLVAEAVGLHEFGRCWARSSPTRTPSPGSPTTPRTPPRPEC